MPQVVLLIAVGAGVYAGLKMVSRLVEQAAKVARPTREKAQRAVSPKDLGLLEWDEAAKVYRPKH